MLIYKHAQSNIIILHRHVAVTSVTNIRVYYNNNTIKIQRVVQNGMIKPFDVAFEILCRSLYSRNFELSLKCSTVDYHLSLHRTLWNLRIYYSFTNNCTFY